LIACKPQVAPVETSQTTPANESASLVVNCPLKVSQTQGETDIEFLDERGELVKGIHGADRVQPLKIQILGFCPGAGSGAQKIQIITNVNQGLDGTASSFSVIDADFKTTNLSSFFLLNADKTGFYVPEDKVQKMWNSLPKNEYEFSANLISEDFEIAEEFAFNLEIR